MEPKLDETVERKLIDRHLIAILSIEWSFQSFQEQKKLICVVPAS